MGVVQKREKCKMSDEDMVISLDLN